MGELSDNRYQGQFRPEFSRLHRDRDLYWVVPFGQPLIVAVLGKRFTGKTTALSYLSERHGFRIYTLGGVLRELARERGLLGGRLDLEAFGDEIRQENEDPAVLARWVLRKIRRDQLTLPRAQRGQQRIGIAGIKHLSELMEFIRLDSFRTLLLTTKNNEIRFKRAKKSGVLMGEWMSRDYPASAFRKLTSTEQHEFFAKLDSSFDEGHASPFDDRYRGCPVKAVEFLTEPKNADRSFAPERVINETFQLNNFFEQLNDVARERLIPRSHVMLS